MDQHPAAAYDALPPLAGQYYQDSLANLHRFLKPKTYLEIGVYTGDTLSLSKSHSIAIDPNFEISQNVFQGKPACHFFQTTSDAFFETRDPTAILGDKIDFAFLDGMHLFEFLLRDFYNTERSCRPNSIIALHDCLPIDFRIAARSEEDPIRFDSAFSSWWTGDVWKTLLILKTFRPDLKIYPFDSAPTGLVLITGLSPENQMLKSSYYEIIDEFRDITLEDYGVQRYFDELGILPSSLLNTPESIAERFWL